MILTHILYVQWFCSLLFSLWYFLLQSLQIKDWLRHLSLGLQSWSWHWVLILRQTGSEPMAGLGPRHILVTIATFISGLLKKTPKTQTLNIGFPGGSVVRNLPANSGDVVCSLVQEDLTWHGASKPVSHICWTWALEPGATTPEAQVPWGPRFSLREATIVISPHTTPRGKSSQQQRPSTAKIK